MVLCSWGNETGAENEPKINDKGGLNLKTAIIYYSKHHGNTKKVLDAIAASDPGVELVDVTEKNEPDLSRYDRIGFASGIYYGKFAEQVLNFAKGDFPTGKDVAKFNTCSANLP